MVILRGQENNHLSLSSELPLSKRNVHFECSALTTFWLPKWRPRGKALFCAHVECFVLNVPDKGVGRAALQWAVFGISAAVMKLWGKCVVARHKSCGAVTLCPGCWVALLINALHSGSLLRMMFHQTGWSWWSQPWTDIHFYCFLNDPCFPNIRNCIKYLELEIYF